MNKGLTVGFVYNVRKTEEDYKEWDEPATIETVASAMEASGNRVLHLEARNGNIFGGRVSDDDIFVQLARHSSELDIVFNIAEGYQGVEDRESYVPSLLNRFGIPHTGSGPISLATSLDKVRTKEVIRSNGIPTADYYVLDPASHESQINDLLDRLSFPMFVKPIYEGTGVGIDTQSRVVDVDQLRKKVNELMREYRKPVLVEKFLDGKEYTVGFVGNIVFPVLELDFENIESATHRDGVTSTFDKFSPAGFDSAYLDAVQSSLRVHRVLGCDDYNRLDLRAKDGVVYVLESNPLPGLNPTKSDFVIMADYAGINHEQLVNMVVNEAVNRYLNDQRAASQFGRRLERLGTNSSNLREYLSPTLSRLGSQTHSFVSSNGLSCYKLLKPVDNWRDAKSYTQK